ncbi:Oligopeptide ABC transporter, periplasmic oligopeptide-binding protein OppA (TC 3.A.1.5.1) [hydrothermal vent metagenome]|uniref:Oligopeptide ABC transporter, periplasmic oligopeptide-binding protein OppA (TC 3.A.1.5.1) n=1 Tax=hydrothermal vent metagenome TaxID=652676 RepID=A0A3B1DKE1_9ZZZZ
MIISSSSILFSKNSHARNKTKKIKPTYGGTLVWGTANPPTRINPVLTSHSVSSALLALIFDALVRIDSNGDVVPGLAESWDISEDGLLYTFHLNQNVRFHDGKELTAEDIKFTYDLINDPKNNSHWRTNTELIDNWKVLNKYTIQLTLIKPFPQILRKLIREIIPKHLFDNKNLHTNFYNYNPIGSGPFRFKSWNKETDQIELIANLNYFERRPYLDNIIIKTYADAAKLWIALMKEEVDFVKFISRRDFLVLDKDAFFKTYRIPLEMYYAILYNPQDPIFHDKELRKAIAHGINKQEIMKAINMYGAESTGPFHPKSIGFNPDVKPLEYNPYKARMMLMHRRWRDVYTGSVPKNRVEAYGGSDTHGGEYGIRRKGAQDLELKLLVDATSEMKVRMAIAIRQNLAHIGIKTTFLRYHNISELTPEYLKKHKPQAWLRRFQAFKSETSHSAKDWYSSSTEFGKLWHYKNETVDLLFQQARTMQNQNESAKIYQHIHKIIYADQPACFLFFPTSFHAVTANLKNTDAFFNIYMPGRTIKDWYIAN